MSPRSTRRPTPRGPPWRTTLCVAALAVATSGAQADPIFGVIDGPINLLADVTQASTPGAIVFSGNARAVGTITGPLQRAEFLHLVPAGLNTSGLGPGIRSGFASSLAESDGNGGVGVSNTLFGPHLDRAQTTTADLVSQAVWTQTFVHAGLGPTDITLSLEIPPVQVGLFGAGPARSRPSDTETAQATATVNTFITRADGSSRQALAFDYGIETHEVQFARPGTGFISNEVVAFGIGDTDDARIERGGSNFSPIFTLPAFSADVRLGTLSVGDELTYTYTLQARGTTNAGERGYHAFIGDPFGVETVSGNLRSRITLADPGAGPGPAPGPVQVPVPSTAWLLVAGLALLLGRPRRLTWACASRSSCGPCRRAACR